MKNSETTSKTLYDLLVSKNLDPEVLDSRGNSISDINDGEVYSFDFTVDDKNYGTVVITLSGSNDFEVYYGDNLGKGMDKEHRSAWYDFLHHLKSFASRNMMRFSLKDFTKLKHGMRVMNTVNENIFESYYGGKRVSYNKSADGAKLKIRHSKKLEETDPRYRFVEELFVETNSGERFKLPFKNLNAAKAMVRHVSEGGTPYDAFGQHIHNMVKEMNSITHFVRKHNRNLDEDVITLVTDAKNRRSEIKRNLKSLSSKRGYSKYHESWHPATVDTKVMERIETFENNYIPVEDSLKMFESWIAEETYNLPDTEQQRDTIAQLANQGLVAGVDGLEANNTLADIVDDETLFDLIAKLGEKNPQANIFSSSAIIQRFKELGIDLDLQEVDDIDTGKVALRAERDPMLESIKKLL